MGKVLRKISFREVYEEWLKSKKGELKPSSYVKYRNIVKSYLIGRFGDKDIRTISYEDVKKHFDKLKLDELDTIEYYQQPGKAHHLSEITAKQCELYELMGVNVPS